MRATISKRLIMSAALISVMSWAESANAGPINLTVTTPSSLGQAQSDLAALLSSATDFETEDFEGFDVGTLTESQTDDRLVTEVGRFGRNGGSDGTGACNNSTATSCASPSILNSELTPYNGRFNTTDSLNADNWLDSNDVTDMIWEIEKGDIGFDFNNLSFFLTDMGDVGGTLTVELESGGTASTTISTQNSGTLNWVRAEFMEPIMSATLEFSNSSTNDGFGIDDPTVFRLASSDDPDDPVDPGPSPAPEPATLALIGTGLAGLGLASRRRRRAG